MLDEQYKPDGYDTGVIAEKLLGKRYFICMFISFHDIAGIWRIRVVG